MRDVKAAIIAEKKTRVTEYVIFLQCRHFPIQHESPKESNLSFKLSGRASKFQRPVLLLQNLTQREKSQFMQ